MHKLFWDDPYKNECEAIVTKVNENKIYLDQTVFFAFSGGQASDSGTINDITVKEAVAENEEIYYILEENKTFPQGEKVEVKIDLEKRKRIMRLHSAAHIVYFLIIRKIGKQQIIGSNVYEDKSRLDFLYDKNLSEIVPELQKEINEIIEKGLKIKIYNDTDNPGRRFWEIDGYEKMHCGGTHLKNTKEIGNIKLKRKNIGAGKERIEIILD